MDELMKLLSCVRLFATPRTLTYQAPPFMGFPRQEYWSGLPFPSPGDLPDPGIEPGSPALEADSLTSEPFRPRFFAYQCYRVLKKKIGKNNLCKYSLYYDWISNPDPNTFLMRYQVSGFWVIHIRSYH